MKEETEEKPKTEIIEDPKYGSIKELQARFYTRLSSAERLKYLACLGSIFFIFALTLLFKDYIAKFSSIRSIYWLILNFFSLLTYLEGWRLVKRQRNQILANSFLIIGAILFPISIWGYSTYILKVENRDLYLIIGFLCVLLYTLTAIRLSSVIFSYMALFTLHTSLFLILYRSGYSLKWLIFTSTLLALLYVFIANYLKGQNKPFFIYPLMVLSLGGLFFSALNFWTLDQIESAYLPAYLLICGILIFNQIAQIQIDPRYPFLGIPFIVIIYARQLIELDLTYYWMGILFSTCSLLLISIRLGFKHRFSVHLENYLLFSAMTLIIFSLPIDIVSYVYLTSKLLILGDLNHFYLPTTLSLDIPGKMWKELHTMIYYLSQFSSISIAVMISLLLAALIAIIAGRLASSQLFGFYSIIAFLGSFTVALIKVWHPLLYMDYYFIFYLGLAFLLLLILINLSQKSKEIQRVFMPPLYSLVIISLLISVIAYIIQR